MWDRNDPRNNKYKLDAYPLWLRKHAEKLSTLSVINEKENEVLYLFIVASSGKVFDGYSRSLETKTVFKLKQTPNAQSAMDVTDVGIVMDSIKLKNDMHSFLSI